jgi:hypothetical protein
MARSTPMVQRIVTIGEPDLDFSFDSFFSDAERQLSERIVTIKSSPGLARDAHRLLDEAPRRHVRTRLFGIEKRRSKAKRDDTRRIVEIVAPGARMVSSSGAPPAVVKAQEGARGCRQGNPHAAGYNCRRADDAPIAVSAVAKLANGRPSILRCIWRGMYKVRGREGTGVRDGLHSRVLQRTLRRYTQQGSGSIYNAVNRTLARARGRDLPSAPSHMRAWCINLVAAVRLLWEEGGVSKVYRGVPKAKAALQPYELARASGGHVVWDAFASCSRTRSVARGFAGDDGGAPTMHIAHTSPTARTRFEDLAVAA